MAEYKSNYTGQQIDAGIEKANTAVQPADLADVATSGSYNDLSNKPSEVTETTVANWGFTKNTGTYSKPNDGIPKTDLAEAVQTSLGKADTAIQQHQSLDDYYTKEQVDGKVSSVYRYRGTVSTYGDLPDTDLTVGDVYNITTADSTHEIKAGDNVAWTGSAWDILSGTVDLTGYQTKIDSSHKLSADLVDDTSTTNKFVTSSDKTTWNGKSVVSGTNDGTNWTTLTIDGTTKNIPAGGSSAEEIYPIAITATPNSTNIELAPAQEITLQNMGSEAPGYTAAPYTTLHQVSYNKPYDAVLAEFHAGHQYLLPLITADSSMLMYGIAESGMPVFDDDHPCAILIQLSNGAINSVMMISNSTYGPDGTEIDTSLRGYFYSDTEFSFNASGIGSTDIATAISDGKIPVAIIDWRYKDYQSWCEIKSFDEEDYYFEGEYKGNKFTLECNDSYWQLTWLPISVVSGTNDGTNWSTITINGTTKNIPSGGGGGSSDNVELVHFTLRQGAQTHQEYVCEYTLAEITEMIDNGKALIAVFQTDVAYGNGMYIYAPMFHHSGSKRTVSGLVGNFWTPDFCFLDIHNNYFATLSFQAYFNEIENWMFFYRPYTQVVQISTEWDEGEGAWTEWSGDTEKVISAINNGEKIRLVFYKDDMDTETTQYVDLTCSNISSIYVEEDEGEGEYQYTYTLVGYKMLPSSNTMTKYIVSFEPDGDFEVQEQTYTLTTSA